MEQHGDLKRVLAEEIRAAIAEVSPARAASDAGGDAGTAEARGALRRAGDLMTPSVPDRAPLAVAKRLAIRAFRFLWRNQSSFNSLSLAAGAGLADSLDRLRAEFERQADELRRRAGVQEARLTLAESGAPPAGPGGSGTRGGVQAPGSRRAFTRSSRNASEELRARSRAPSAPISTLSATFRARSSTSAAGAASFSPSCPRPASRPAGSRSIPSRWSRPGRRACRSSKATRSRISRASRPGGWARSSPFRSSSTGAPATSSASSRERAVRSQEAVS